MGWRCTGCGRYGERAGAFSSAREKAANWCVRQGIASLWGVNQCCLCLGLGEGRMCSNCRRIAGFSMLAEPSLQAQRAGLAGEDRHRLAAHTLHGHGVRPLFEPRQACDKVKKAKRIDIFEFDGALFRTPSAPSWFPRQDYHSAIESLQPPNVPTTPQTEWWDAKVVAEARAAIEEEETYTVLLTYRHAAFERRIRELVLSQGLAFDEFRFRSLCSCCSRLGFTHVPRCLCPSCAPQLSIDTVHKANVANASVQSTEVTHTLVILADILSTAANARIVRVWLPNQGAAGLRVAEAPLLNTVLNSAKVGRGDRADPPALRVEACFEPPMPSGEPNRHQLDLWQPPVTGAQLEAAGTQSKVAGNSSTATPRHDRHHRLVGGQLASRQ